MKKVNIKFRKTLDAIDGKMDIEKVDTIVVVIEN